MQYFSHKFSVHFLCTGTGEKFLTYILYSLHKYDDPSDLLSFFQSLSICPLITDWYRLFIILQHTPYTIMVYISTCITNRVC